MEAVIKLRGLNYHMFRGAIFRDFEPSDWTRVHALHKEFERRTAKAHHKCRTWAIDTIVNERIKEYDHGYQASHSVQER